MAKLPAPPAEVACDTGLAGLAPAFREAVEKVLAAHPEAVVAESCRSPERQAFLYGFGRTYDDGRGIVTNAPTNELTWHGYGLAVDVIHRTLRWDAPESWWQALGKTAKDNGLVWGGGWQTLPDKPHIQWGRMTRSPLPGMIAMLRKGQLTELWCSLGAG